MLYDALMRFALRLVEMNVVPDFLLRRGIRFLLALRLRELKAPTGEEQQRRLLVRAHWRAAGPCVEHSARGPFWLGCLLPAVAAFPRPRILRRHANGRHTAPCAETEASFSFRRH